MSDHRETIGRYEVRDELGRGAMGVVHRAHDPVMGRDVAVKTIRLPAGLAEPARDEFRERFLREARAAGRLSHPGIVTVYEFDQQPGSEQPYLAMEYVQGPTLQRLIADEGSLNPVWLLDVVETLADALDTAHAAGVVHRDLKPANILVRESDGAAKIADFGVARIDVSELTQVGSTYGSPAYLAPERIHGQRADGRSDLFSLAVILYEGLTGQRPFGGTDLASISHSILHDPPRSVREIEPDLSPAFDTFFAKALAKDPEDRFQRGAEMRESLALVRREQESFSNGAATMVIAVTPDVEEEAPASKSAAAVPQARAREASSASGAEPVDPLELEPESARPALVISTRFPMYLRWLVVGAAAIAIVLISYLAAWIVRGPSGPTDLSSRSASRQPMRAPVVAPALDPAAISESAVTYDGDGTAPVEEPPPVTVPLRSPEPVVAPDTPSSAPTATGIAAPKKQPPARNEPVEATPPPSTVPGFVEPQAMEAEPEPLPGAVVPQPVRLGLLIQSGLKDGKLSVLVDGDEVYATQLESGAGRWSRMVKKATRRASDLIQSELEVHPGAHTLAVLVTASDGSKRLEEQIEVEIAPDETRTLRVFAGGIRGRRLEVALQQ